MKRLLLLIFILSSLTMRSQTYEFKIRKVNNTKVENVTTITELLFKEKPEFSILTNKFSVVCKTNISKRELKRSLREYGYIVTYFRKSKLVKALRD